MASQDSKPVILILSISDEGNEGILKDVWADLLANLTARATVKHAFTAQEAASLLDRHPKPTGIFIADPGLTDPKNTLLSRRVVQYVQSGGTAVFGAIFSSYITPPAFARYFHKMWSMPWKFGDYYRTTTVLNEKAHGQPGSGLPASYSQKAAYVDNVTMTSAWYLDPDRFDPNQPISSPVVLAKVGTGRLGYTGDVNAETETTAVVLSMFGLLFNTKKAVPDSKVATGAKQNIPASASGSTRYSIVKSYGDRKRFQASYGLTMTPEDIDTGNRILDAMIEQDARGE